jgi:CheY-like chemotaxis protein
MQSSDEPLRDRTILVVDDVTDHRVLMALTLRRAGATVIEAASAIEARHGGAAIPFDAVVSDIAMPEHDGRELMGWLRLLRGPALVAIAVSGHTDAAHRQRALEAGFDCFLAKPVAPDELVAQVCELIARRDARF